MNTTIEEQIKTNHEAYLIVSQSKESTLKFLEDIGATKRESIDGSTVTKHVKDIYKGKNSNIN